LQPQPPASACELVLAVPQHDAFADGAQQLACSDAEQHPDTDGGAVSLAAAEPASTIFVSY
jgi:hypothetical protein